MNSKEEEIRTITELVTRSESSGSGQGNNSYTRNPDTNNRKSVTSVKKQQTIEIKKRLQQQHMVIEGSDLGPEYYDEYRRIKRPLLSNAFGKTASTVERGNLIMVTSSVPGEGKTHTSLNLALSMAQERDHTVLLIDCDVTRYGTSRALGIEDKPGLIEILEDDAFTVGDAILRTDIPELCVISAGRQSGYVTELLASQKMRQMVEEIGTRYDDRIIIFDAPPLLPTPQTQVLANLVGQVVFVIEAGKTPQVVVDEAINLIPEDQATGIVMNKSEGMTARGNYYYGYYNSK